jgi:hypothetical protein
MAWINRYYTPQTTARFHEGFLSSKDAKPRVYHDAHGGDLSLRTATARLRRASAVSPCSVAFAARAISHYNVRGIAPGTAAGRGGAPLGRLLERPHRSFASDAIHFLCTATAGRNRHRLAGRKDKDGPRQAPPITITHATLETMAEAPVCATSAPLLAQDSFRKVVKDQLNELLYTAFPITQSESKADAGVTIYFRSFEYHR